MTLLSMDRVGVQSSRHHQFISWHDGRCIICHWHDQVTSRLKTVRVIVVMNASLLPSYRYIF